MFIENLTNQVMIVLAGMPFMTLLDILEGDLISDLSEALKIEINSRTK